MNRLLLDRYKTMNIVNDPNDKTTGNATDESTKKKKKMPRETPSSQSQWEPRKSSEKDLKFSSFAGIEKIIDEIRSNIERPLKHPELYERLGIEAPRYIPLMLRILQRTFNFRTNRKRKNKFGTRHCIGIRHTIY